MESVVIFIILLLVCGLVLRQLQLAPEQLQAKPENKKPDTKSEPDEHAEKN